MVRRVQDGVVRVTAGRKGGSGFIFDTQGDTAFVVTNHHVIEDEGAIDVRVENARTYKATLLGYDSDKDVAVMSICCNSGFKALGWDSGASAKVGDQVVAVGYPRTSSRRVTATLGEVKNDWAGTALGYISHDAPLNPGNSGGPLFSIEGKVLGVNTASSRVTEGLFYAVPYSTIGGDVADWKSRLIVIADPSPTPTPSGSWATPTPRPSPTSTPASTCPTVEDVIYLAALVGHLERIQSSASAIGDLASEAADNPLLIFDDSWKTRMGVALAVIEIGAEGILALDAPSSASKVSTPAEAMAHKLLRVTVLFARGFDRLDLNALEEGLSLFRSVSDDLNAMSIAVDSFCE